MHGSLGPIEGLKEGSTVTVLTVGSFGIIKTEGKVVGSRNGAIANVTIVPKGKRKPHTLHGGGASFFLVILDGIGHPEPPDILQDTGDGGRQTRHSSFAREWYAEANEYVNNIDPNKILFDQRFSKSANVGDLR